MPELLHPGVYVQEVSSGLQPIQGVSTSTAAFIGVTDKGPIPGTKLPSGRVAQPGLVTSMSDYLRRYGGFRSDSFLTYAVQAFYQNGGKRLYIVRVAPADVATAALGTVSSPISPPAASDALALRAASPGAWGSKIWVSFAASSDGIAANFRLNVMYGATLADAQQNVVESYDNVTVASTNATDPLPSNYVVTVINSRSEYVTFNPTATAVTVKPVAGGPFQFLPGSDGTVANVNFIGSAAADNSVTGTGLYALDKITDVSLIAIPGRGDTTTLNAGIDYCKNQRPLNDCFFIGDVGIVTDVKAARSPDASASVATIADARTFAVSGIGAVLDKSAGDYGAIYFPWVFATDPIGAGSNPKILLPPSGFVTGIYARTDNSRGVFKAPAGTEAGVAGALGPFVQVSDTEQDVLNPVSLNVIRTVPTSGLVVWGARTIGSDAEWRYVPVRRMAIFLRTSIYYGIQWAVFEPNAEPLWASLRLNIRAFMLTQFRAGAFKGVKPSDAFFVLCDGTTTTQTDIDNGVVNILVGFAPLKPAEFVVLKLSQIVNQPAS